MCIFDYQGEYYSKITIVGIPSGEAFDVNGVQLYNLSENDLIKFNFKKEFWFFLDKNVDRIKLRLK